MPETQNYRCFRPTVARPVSWDGCVGRCLRRLTGFPNASFRVWGPTQPKRAAQPQPLYAPSGVRVLAAGPHLGDAVTFVQQSKR
jgi:hypothetical protein